MIDHLPPLREVIARSGLKADKNLGQNFLLDLNITDKIVREAAIPKDIQIYEVGPGPGGLTRALLKAGHNVKAIEADTRTQPILDELKTASPDLLSYEFGDALAFDWSSIPDRSAIISNLPYNIATPLILKWLRLSFDRPPSIERMALMVQKEVAVRICSAPDQKSYGRLSVMCQWLMDASIIVSLGPQAFTPPPKVESSVVLFLPKKERLKADFKDMERVVACAFNQRRKMIRTSLKKYDFNWDALGIDPTKRAENLSVHDFVVLAQAARSSSKSI